MKITKILMATTVLAFSAASVNAATQGALGATSSGTAGVTMDVLEQVQISAIDDFVLDNGSGGTANTYEPGAGDVSQTSTICVHYNNDPSVSLQIDSANTPDYRLTDGTDFIDYELEVDELGGTAFVTHAEGANVTYPNAADPDAACSNKDVTIRAYVTDTSAVLPVANGTYIDTLTYTLAPNP